MSATSGDRRIPRYTAYDSVQAYNTAHPDAPMPLSPDARNMLRSFTCAGAGLKDDLTASEKTHTLDFLPGGAPGPGQPDRTGTVVATHWGNPPYLVLAENVSLRKAWEAITARWPSDLSAAVEALRDLADRAVSDSP
ncbi:hypothetical protein AB0F91_47165 [Amycolatopsis sp. NPDC023774]|uniref:hypothetical protein n=1 Tax=Amycolatopsis sp. NPDC023774 TaxID=3155015 RepID=UPI00340ECCE0